MSSDIDGQSRVPDRVISSDRGVRRQRRDNVMVRDRTDVSRQRFHVPQRILQPSPSFLRNRFANNNLGSTSGFSTVVLLTGNKPSFARSGRDHIFFSNPHSFVSFDRHRFFNKRIISPNQCFVFRDHFGHHTFFRPFFPFYHQRFVFFNPCGFWPGTMATIDITCMATSRITGTDTIQFRMNTVTGTTNYYTYNYYGSPAQAETRRI